MGKFYLYLYRCFFPILRFLAEYILPLFNDKIKEGVQLRKKYWPHLPRKNVENFWFHCSSGEFEYAKPVINKIKKVHPESQIIVTYFSPSYRLPIEQCEDVDQSYPLPWDQIKPVQTFIQHVSPHCLIIAKTDLWPELIYQVSRKNIPLFLIAGNFYRHQKLSNLLLRPLYHFLLSRFKRISCISQEDDKILKQISPNTLSSFDGDPRYEQVLLRLQTPYILKINLKKTIQKENSLIMGSTWTQDEKQLFITMKTLRSQLSTFSFILVPHEPNTKHLLSICDQLTDQGFTVRLYSEAIEWHPGEVLLVDEKGLLAHLYTWSAYAFVGGSFKKTVHSVMEPLAAGCLTFIGPHNQNNREAQLFKHRKIDSDANISPVTEIKTGKELALKIISLNKSKTNENLKVINTNITDQIKENLGSSEKISQFLLDS